MATVRWTGESERWLKNIFDYIAQEGYPDRAKQFVSELIRKGDSLRVFPEVGSVYLSRNNVDIRVVYYGHYRIAYHIKDDVVFILGVFHGRMLLEDYVKITQD